MTTLTGCIYLDTNVFVYALEGYDEFRQVLTALFQRIDRGLLQAVTSELTLAEVLVKPLLDRNQERETAYHHILRSSSSLQVIPITREVLIAAARLRAGEGLKLPDAIHAATATLTNCQQFLTNDTRFKNIPGLPVLLLSQL
ncbi:MAG: PIN domain-containing protein [Nitrospira sp.]|nr:PIN domain-containing protein [Nitrospira sp.]